MSLEYLKQAFAGYIPTRTLVWYSGAKQKYRAKAKKRELNRTIRTYGLFNAEEMCARLEDLGVSRGKALIVQSNLNALTTFRGRHDQIIEGLKELVGNEGTICMPTYPKGFGKQEKLFFDVQNTPSAAGLLTELFRRHPGVIRSLQPTHTISAIGPLARFFTEDHHLSPYPCGEKSAWTRIAWVDGLLVGLGLPAGYTTVWHAVEAALGSAFPLNVYLPEKRTFIVRDYSGNSLTVPVWVRRSDLRAEPSKFLDELPEEANKFCLFHGVPLFVIKARPFLDTMKEFALNGRTMYA